MNRVPIESLRTYCETSLQKVGLSAEDAGVASEALITTDSWGVFTHGTKLLSGYVRRLHGGGWKVAGRPRIERQGPGWAIVHGDDALGQIGGEFAMRVAMEKARVVGIAYVGLRETAHIGAAGYFASLAAREGLIGIVMGNDIPSVAAPHSRTAVLGSNPLAYGIPSGSHDPILLDMATAAVAGGKVYAAHQRGEPIPDTWLIGPDGRPTSDGSLYPHQAALAPMAGHKGYGLGLLCEVFAGLLSGGTITWEIGSWIFDDPAKSSRHNAGFLAIDVNTIAPRDEFLARVDKLIDEIHNAPKATGVDRIYVPGEMEWERRRVAQREGIALPADVRAKLSELTEFAGYSPDWLASST
jgi:LDH2 family malate/lactate/ureidoglycolate dehydrogenase